jgi:predicted transcriptional regulator
MSSAAILSIKPPYANQILSGTKTIELRKSSMNLLPNDVILVYSSAPEQIFSFWFRIKTIETLPLEVMWDRYHTQLGIAKDEYLSYFSRCSVATGLHVCDVHPLAPISLKETETLVPGFVPPQGIILLRNELGRFKKFLEKLSSPLPPDVFPQISFNI